MVGVWPCLTGRLYNFIIRNLLIRNHQAGATQQHKKRGEEFVCCRRGRILITATSSGLIFHSCGAWVIDGIGVIRAARVCRDQHRMWMARNGSAEGAPTTWMQMEWPVQWAYVCNTIDARPPMGISVPAVWLDALVVMVLASEWQVQVQSDWSSSLWTVGGEQKKEWSTVRHPRSARHTYRHTRRHSWIIQNVISLTLVCLWSADLIVRLLLTELCPLFK